MPEFAKSYSFGTVKEVPTIDGQEIPWYVDARGPLVEDLGRGVHLLWVPVLIDGPVPTPPQGTPDGEPLANASP